MITMVVWEDSTAYAMARVTGPNGENIVQADVSSISLIITKAGESPGTDTALTVSASVFNALQTDARWTVDDTGYNFRHTITPAMIADPGDYMFEYKLTFTGGEVAPIPIAVHVKNLLRS